MREGLGDVYGIKAEQRRLKHALKKKGKRERPERANEDEDEGEVLEVVVWRAFNALLRGWLNASSDETQQPNNTTTLNQHHHNSTPNTTPNNKDTEQSQTDPSKGYNAAVTQSLALRREMTVAAKL